MSALSLPWASLAVTSVAGSISLVRLAPNYSASTSYVQTFFALFLAEIIFTIFYNAILYPKLFSPLRHLPTPSGGSFINGHFKRIAKEPTGAPHTDWFKDVPNDGVIYYTSLLNQERVMPTTPQALAEVLTAKSYEFVKPSVLRNGLGRILGVGLILSEGEEHRIQRKNLMPAFAYRHVKDLYPVFWAKSTKLVNALMAVVNKEDPGVPLSETPVIEIGNWGSRAALDIIGVAGMGKDFNAIDNPETELNRTYRKVFEPTKSGQILNLMGFFLPQWLIRAIPVSHNNNIIEASETIKKVARGLIRAKKEKLERTEKRTEVDILSVAIESGGFSEEDLVNQMMTFLAAGHETTATTLIWAFYCLGQNLSMQTRLREEIRCSLPSLYDKDAVMSSEVLDKCQYLHAVCNEVLRLYSPVPATLRETSCNTTIQNSFIPKGTTVILPIKAINTNTKFWGADADKFNPDRWMGSGKTNTGGAQSNYAFMTFLHGPRSCIGQAFAKAEFACLLASVVGRFEFELEDKDKEIEIGTGITAKPKGGLNVRMRPLDGW